MTPKQMVDYYLWDGETEAISDDEFLEQLKLEQEALTKRLEEAKSIPADKPVITDYQDLYAWRWKLQGKSKEEIKAKWESEFPDKAWRE